jgi:hypothetical protein
VTQEVLFGIGASRRTLAPTEEVNMKLANFTLEQLKALPLRAIVAFAARCARRVEPLAQLPEGNVQRESRREAVEAALRMAESFASGTNAPPDESVVAAIDASRESGGEPATVAAASSVAQTAHAAASAWQTRAQAAEENRTPGKQPIPGRSVGALSQVTADVAAMCAYTAAAAAFLSVGYRNEESVDSALQDYHNLMRLELGRYPELAAPVDPSPGGPLGPL